MTRETKIGLLVGLAFIIVIGILLSDHIGSTTEPLQASLTSSGNNVLSGVAAPGADSGTTAVVTPQRVVPQNYIPASHDAQPPVGPRVDVTNINGNDPDAGSRSGTGDSGAPGSISRIEVVPQPGPEVAVNDSNTGRAATNLPHGLRDLVNEHAADLTPAGPDGNGPPVGIRNDTGNASPAPRPSASPAAQPGAPAGYRQIKAEEGDNVTKFAIKYMGGNSKANREAIIRANPSMTPDGHVVIAGRTYLVPAPATPGDNIVQQPAPRAPAPAPASATARRDPAPPTPPGVVWYTVKENDNLWKIAADQLGAGNRWAEIRDLNQDTLKGGEQLHVNMRLKLPAKAVAENN